jgi:uncharacterized membrane protein YeaQ/YmgE (transglycosylase-associated protein family)
LKCFSGDLFIDSLTIGGTLLGLIIGFIVGFICKKMPNDSTFCLNALLMSGFIGYFMAETICSDLGLKISGIMTIISSGIYLRIFSNSNFK